MGDILAAGIDVGASVIKVAVTRTSLGNEEILATAEDRIRRRDPREVVRTLYREALERSALSHGDIHYVASTGEGELVEFRQGHFYGMTTHARGGLHLDRRARAILDIGALHARAVRMDERGRVLDHRMTSQCASGSGQFLENIARYLGVSLEEVGPLSLQASTPEKISSICAVLAETDVINMVSRGISTSDILRGIHDSIAGRLARLLRTAHVEGVVVLTGGLAADIGLKASLEHSLKEMGVTLELVAHPLSLVAGAIGAALWGAVRYRRLIADERGSRMIEESRAISAQHDPTRLHDS